MRSFFRARKKPQLQTMDDADMIVFLQAIEGDALRSSCSSMRLPDCGKASFWV